MVNRQPAPLAATPATDVSSEPLRLSIIVEWENTRRNGVPRAFALLDTLGRQWQAIAERSYPETLPPEAARFLNGLAPRPELVAVSGEVLSEDAKQEIRRRAPACLDLEIHVEEGLEYYPLKNLGARKASGDLLLFVDSDVLPDEGWLAHLLGSFARPDVHVVSGQTYVGPSDLFSRAFALGWTYELRDRSAKFEPCRKFYGNNVAFRAEVFPKGGFASLGPRTRGASTLLRKELNRVGIDVWQNSQAGVDHPAPSGFQHLVVRALAHGRDIYMTRSTERHLGGLTGSVGTAARRLARGVRSTLLDGHRVGLEWWQIPASLAIVGTYYGFFALGGILTHISPKAMGRRFRL
jgi:Glycosyl transferase family 2